MLVSLPFGLLGLGPPGPLLLRSLLLGGCLPLMRPAFGLQVFVAGDGARGASDLSQEPTGKFSVAFRNAFRLAVILWLGHLRDERPLLVNVQPWSLRLTCANALRRVQRSAFSLL